MAGIRSAGYTTLTPIQNKAIPLSIEGRDLLGLAQTGTGKTAAFAIPLLQKLSAGHTGKIRALVIAPTRELADQIDQHISQLSSGLKIRSITLYGGVSKIRQDEKLRKGLDIVVACPGRLLDHIRESTIDLSALDTLVLDEADTMCDMGFLPDIRKIITHLPSKRQTLFFAATMPSDIRNLAKDILNNPTEVQIGVLAPANTVAHSLYPVTENLKSQLFFRLIELTATGQVIVFTRTKHRTKRLFAELDKKKYNAAALQGNMSQNKRTQAIDGFRRGKFDFLVATDIASRGIDIPEISHVINYDMPNTVDAYIHRIGRTGRAENLGEAITLSIPEDASMITRIERILKSQIERKTIADFDYGTSFDPNRRSAPSRNSNPQSSRNNPRRSSSWKKRKGSGTNYGPANAGMKSARSN
ncbi:MAG: ATP-dependent RNA helicase RhlE [Chloroflexi bacterium]|jgi:ATP-dependent RNA helicase RhlE|nr:MAG: ATP-dependent RNA helicase RhlE [Chloroflexota bacterium]